MSESRPYRPSNGTEGHGFIAAWCDICARDDGGRCPILARTMAHAVDEPSYPTEWSFDDAGAPQCTAYVPAGDPLPPERCPFTIDMFGGAR